MTMCKCKLKVISEMEKEYSWKEAAQCVAKLEIIEVTLQLSFSSVVCLGFQSVSICLTSNIGISSDIGAVGCKMDIHCNILL